MPFPVGLVVKKGLKMRSLTSTAMPVPLSRIRISTWSPRSLVLTTTSGLYPARLLALSVMASKALLLRLMIARPMLCGTTLTSARPGA